MAVNKKKLLGYHYIWDVSLCPADKISLVEDISSFADAACNLFSLSVLGKKANQFAPHGATLIVLLEESHLSIHTWPEEKYMAIDLFSCVEITEPERIHQLLKDHFGESLQIETQYVERGI